MTSSNKADYFDEMHEWSERKLQLLQAYVDSAVKILGSINRVYYIDGFAGRGMYRDGSKGSPVRIAELAKKNEIDGKSYVLKCINVEEDDEHFANLQEETARFGKTVQNFHGRFNDNLAAILKVIGSQPSIFFLDPFGIKGMDWNAINQVIKRGAPTDLWIRFDHVELRRLDGNYEVNESKFDNLTTVYGIHDEAYLHSILDRGETAEERIRDSIQLYRDRLENAFRTAKPSGYVGTYPIRSLTGQIKYYLIFATAHEKGFILASDVVYGVEEDYQRELQEFRELQEREKTQATQLSLFEDPTPEQIFDEKVHRLKEEVWTLCRGEALARSNIHAKILNNWFGRIKSSHMTKALNALKGEGFILEVIKNTKPDKTVYKFRASN